MVAKELLGFTKRVNEIALTVSHARQVKMTDFLNMVEQAALVQVVKKLVDIDVVFAGGFESAERKRAIIFSTFMATEAIDTKVSVFKIEVIGAGEVTHSQVLGSLMGLNIDRSVIGDIVVDSEGAFFASCCEFNGFLKEHFTKVGRHDIRLELVEERIVNDQQFEAIEIIVSSLRLDVVVKALIGASRGKAEEYLDAGFVRLNHAVDKKTSRVCQMGDILSIRKHGRFRLVDIKKMTKSGKFVLNVSKRI